MSHRVSVPAQSSWRRHRRWRRLYPQQVFRAMPTKRVSSAPGHVVTVTRLGRAEHLGRDHLQGGRLPIPLRRVGRHDDRTRTHQALSGDASPARGCSAPLRSRGLSSPEVRHVAIGHGEAAHVSLAPGLGTVFFDRCCRTASTTAGCDLSVAHTGGTSWIMRR